MSRKRKWTDEELVGKTFNHLRLVKPLRERTRLGRLVIRWECVCVCGKTVKRRESSIVNNRAFSCGCKFRDSCGLGANSSQWKGHGEISGHYFNTIEFRCRKLGREFTVTIREAWELYLRQGRRCALTGLPVGFATQRQQRNGLAEQTASLDRIDSKKGYTPDNVQWVHKDVNKMKNDFPQERFVEICRLVAALAGGEASQVAA